MGFMHMFGRRASSNAATAIVQPVTPQKTAVTSKSSPGSQPSAAKRVRTKIGKKLAAFSLRRHDGVTTVTVNKEHYMPSLQDSGYASGYIEQIRSSPPMTPVATNEDAIDAIHKSKATKIGEPITEDDNGGAQQATDELIAMELQQTPCPKPTRPPTKAKDTIPSKTFHDLSDRHSALTPRPKKATHTHNISASIPITNPLRIRSVIQDLAYHAAIHHNPKAQTTIDAIENVQKLSCRTSTYLYDPLFEHAGYQFTTSQLDAPSHAWLARAILAQHLDALTHRRLLHPEDSEVLKFALFLTEKHHIRAPETLYILLDALVSPHFASTLRTLALSLPEFTAGSAATARSATTTTTPAAHRARALRHLIEAAVYPRPTAVWKAVRYADARAQLRPYIAAYECTHELGVGTPPALTPFKRALSFGEERDLLRGRMLLELQARFEAGTLADFGLLKNLRGAYFPVACQPAMDAEELGRFLYARLEGSGVLPGEVPRWVGLHPGFDREFARGEGAERRVREKLEEGLREFEGLERERKVGVEKARRCWEEKVKGEQTRWERLGMKVRGLFRRQVPEVPFDPFAV